MNSTVKTSGRFSKWKGFAGKRSLLSSPPPLSFHLFALAPFFPLPEWLLCANFVRFVRERLLRRLGELGKREWERGMGGGGGGWGCRVGHTVLYWRNVDTMETYVAHSSFRRRMWTLKSYYHSFIIYSRFWLVKTSRIIYHNQLLLTKFAKEFCHIQPMTSKVQPAADYWTIDVKMKSKVQPAADYWTIDVKDYWTIDREILGTRLCY